MNYPRQNTGPRATALSLGIAMALGASAAVAQDSPGADAEQATTLDRIEVTGSRIKRAEIEGSLPVMVLDRTQLEASGDVSVSDFLRTTTFNSFGSFQTTSGSSAAGFSASASGVWVRTGR